jgi:ABC-2 type transport system ATP-binding protein
LQAFADRKADELSGGMYKKLALSCALLHRPRALILDEPTNGVDPVSRRELWELLHEFTAEGMAVLLSTPYMDEAARCHRVALLYQGRTLLSGRPAELLRGFTHPTFEVQGVSREKCESLLLGAAGVVALSPAGERLRLILEPGAEAGVAELLRAPGGHLRKVQAQFEDLYLVHTRAGAARES